MNLGRVPTGPLNTLISRRSSPYTIYTEAEDEEGWTEGSSLSSTNTVVDIDVHGQRTSPQQYPTGETFESTLQGMVTVGDKVSELTNGNCIVHSGTVYEITVYGWPDDEQPSIFVLELDERTDLTPP